MFSLRELISSQEGKILIVGTLMFLLFLMIIALVYVVSVDDANNLVVMSVTNFFFGRAAGISYGYTVEFSDRVIILMNMMIEFIMVMITYPLFVFSWNKSLNVKYLRHFFITVKRQKLKYKSYFQKYGVYGLFLFVWFPFWMTGPVVGAIIGFLIGIKHYTTMCIVLSGTSLAIVIWTYFLKELILLLNQISANAPYILLGLFIAIALTLKVLKSRT
ncbi:MAG: small multi-drug export protein [Campylobacterota bacterium]|nr:small multi-drug export protein [Campylobacterota bacterium]